MHPQTEEKKKQNKKTNKNKTPNPSTPQYGHFIAKLLYE